jgi:hypothetical protein
MLNLLPNRLGAGAFVALGLFAAGALADGRDHDRIEARLKSYQEVPALSTPASGRFRASFDKASQTLQYELSYSGIDSAVRMAHIHFGQRGVNGGIMIWLCQTATNPSPVASTPTCPQSGSVSGVISAADVVGPAGQGIAPTELAEAIAAIRAGVAYVNVHSTAFPGGEIRGQLKDDD